MTDEEVKKAEQAVNRYKKADLEAVNIARQLTEKVISMLSVLSVEEITLDSGRRYLLQQGNLFYDDIPDDKGEKSETLQSPPMFVACSEKTTCDFLNDAAPIFGEITKIANARATVLEKSSEAAKVAIANNCNDCE